jgi:hypothetical protein
MNLTFDKIKLDIVSHIAELLNDRFRSDRFTLLSYKKKIAEQIETNRNAAQEFRKDYDISARNRHDESIRVLQQYEAEKYTEETTRLRNIIKELEHSQSALLKKLSGMEEEKVKLSKAVADSNAASLKISNKLKSIKDAKRKHNRGNDSYKPSVAEPEVPTSPTSERSRSSMASRSSKEFINLANQNTPPSSPSTPVGKHIPQICQKCVIYEEDIKNLKTILIQLTNVNANMEIQSATNDIMPNSRPQMSSSTSVGISRDLTTEIDDSRPTTAAEAISDTITANASTNMEPVPTLTKEEKSQHSEPNVVQIDEPIISSTSNNLIVPVIAKDEDRTDTNENDNSKTSDNKPLVNVEDAIPNESVQAINEIVPVQSESPTIKSKKEPESSAVTAEQVITSNKNVVDNTRPKSKERKKSKQPQITKAQEIPVLNLENPVSNVPGAYQGFGPTSKDLKNINKVTQESPKKHIIDRENLSSVSFASAESEMMRPSSSMSDYNGLRPSTTLSDMSRDERITEDMYDLAKGRGLLSHEALQKINRKNENIIQEYQTKMLSLEYQIRNLSKRIRSDEAFMERLDYLNALKLQERDVLLTAVCNQLKRMKEEKESASRLKNFSKAEMPLQMPKQLIQSKKTLPLPNIKFDIPPERKSSPQSDNNKLVLSNSMPNLPYSRYLESLQPTSNDKIIVSNNPSSPINSNSLDILEEKSFRPNNENQNKVRPRLPITDELYGDEGIEKLLKSDPDALYEYRNIRKQILSLVVEHTPS